MIIANITDMKRLFIISAILMLFYALSAQNATTSVTADRNLDKIARYKLYPTTNMWTFLKLDTRNGRIWQVQWSLEDETRYETPLSLSPIVNTDKEVIGRFILHSTTNIHTFIMLDQINDKTYQVQWSIEPYERMVVPID